ncbi:hypothetical protein [Burkholderia cepacia]|uniref:hypothetical protein n=1 Tax=Burkholderia cepacia TaxID=292 RepID=UPI002AB62128|nr:hypothetical protein [Burkholderia cepacia]
MQEQHENTETPPVSSVGELFPGSPPSKMGPLIESRGLFASATARTIVVGFTAGIFGAAAVMAAAYFLGGPHKFGAVDVNAIFNLRSAVLTDKASSEKTPEGRAALEAEAANTGPKIDHVLAAIQKDCKCVLLVRAAVISNIPDYTEQAKRMLGLDGIDEAALQAKIVNNLVGKFSNVLNQPGADAASMKQPSNPGGK